MQLENYTIEKELSRGPITTVFLATQNALDRPVLLKILNVQWKGEKDLVERFRREAKICARLKHPNIVNIFDFGTTENSFYLAMEYVEGCNLSEFIRKYHPLPFKVIEYIFHELLKGLEYAHGQGVIHRDIKPGNIMIGKDGSVKISDFGLATIGDFPSLTEMGGTVGTPAYMSPEQAEGKKLNPESDMFSLGTTIYEVTSRENPFIGENFAESIRQVLHKKQLPLIKQRPDIPQWFSDITQGLLEKNLQRRAASATEVIQKLRTNSQLSDQSILVDFIKEPSSHTVETTAGPKESKKLLIKRLPIYVSTFVLVLVAIGIFFFRGSEKPIERASTDEPVTKRSQLVDSIQMVNEPKSDPPGEQANLTPDVKTPGKKSAASQLPKQAQTQETFDETNIASENELDISEAKPGAIFISTYPWAKVYINGEYQETTPLSKPLQLKAGTHALKLENPNFATIEREVVIRPGFSDTLNFSLEPAIGFLEIQVIPWAEIHINGKYRETTPLDDPISLPAGQHELRLVNPGFSTWVDSIKIEAGQTFRKKISLLKSG